VLAAKRTLWRFEKGEQHCIFALGQCDHGARGVGELAGLAVELPAGKPKAAALGIARRRCAADIEPSQYRADAREQLTQVEWFGQIIVGAELQPNHPIDVVKAVTG
jgi:hypothetical protein